ncbi:MAG: thiamine diphosphokinase [Rhodobacteraceae bacterium]|nr:thiamine diphosphokinase [Paracoccaceae bacterium]MYF46555.1 thiamine diphosphokinase [Paracoccaceae bacterium]MYG10557.1 thiamine diphosphokinase [Paracoccaceae bacterium]MYI90735.1 thiamine diphosphokinase [Paracoccaceae bacterium]MYJ87572.1 thiamine diphosphokinase [Paracoccaceae bacterium]
MSIDPSQVNFENGVALVGGGTCTPTEFHSVIKHTSNLVGIDGGTQTILDYGFEPDLIIGDLDSFSEEYRKKYRHKTIQILDQDRTDLDKAIGSINAPFLLTVGVLGDRVDHGLGACNILLKYPQKNLLILNNSDLCFLAPPKLSLTLPLNERISLFPFKKMRGKSVGLNWEIDEIYFDPAGMTGISNYCIDTNIHMEFSTPDMIVIMPNSNLPTVIGELQKTAFW